MLLLNTILTVQRGVAWSHAGHGWEQISSDGGEITIETFSRAWRGLERPRRLTQDRPDELHLRRAGQLLSEFGTLWRNPAVPDRLREEALREIFSRFDVDGAQIIAVHPQPNENAWLLGLMAAREQRLLPQRVMGLVGARGLRTSISFSWPDHGPALAGAVRLGAV